MRHFRGIASCFFFLVGLFALAEQAGAQGVIDMGGLADQEAKSHFKVGKSLYESGRFAEAAVEFEQAYKLSNKVDLLYNVYVAHRDASDLPKAIDALRRYLELAEIEPQARVNLQARLNAMEEANARAAAAPGEAPAQPAPGGTEPTTALAPEPPPPAEPAPQPAPAPGSAELELDGDSDLLPYVLIAVGGTALVAGGITAAIGASKISDIEDACPDDACPPASEFDLAGERDDAKLLRTLAFALIGGGVVVGGAGAVLLLLQDGGSAPAEAAPAAALRCGPGGCLGTLSGRF